MEKKIVGFQVSNCMIKNNKRLRKSNNSVIRQARQILIDEEYEKEMKMVDNRQLEEILQKLLHTLTPNEEYVTISRFGLFGNAALSYVEIAKVLGLSLERCRQIALSAMLKLRHKSRSGQLVDFNEQ